MSIIVLHLRVEFQNKRSRLESGDFIIRFLAFWGALAVSGCVGESYYYYGFPAVSSPTASGNFSGVAASDTDVYSDGSGNGYVLAYAKGYDAWDLGVTGAFPGDRAFVAIAGIFLQRRLV